MPSEIACHRPAQWPASRALRAHSVPVGCTASISSRRADSSLPRPVPRNANPQFPRCVPTDGVPYRASWNRPQANPLHPALGTNPPSTRRLCRSAHRWAPRSSNEAWCRKHLALACERFHSHRPTSRPPGVDYALRRHSQRDFRATLCAPSNQAAFLRLERGCSVPPSWRDDDLFGYDPHVHWPAWSDGQ